MCDNEADTPFCSPESGARLQAGQTIEITWNPLFFTTTSAQAPDEIFIQADFATTNNGAPETTGFTSSALDPNTGTFPWAILDAYLPPNRNTTTARLSIAAPLPRPTANNTFTRIGAATITFPGPQVHILRSTPNPPPLPPANNQSPPAPPPQTQTSPTQPPPPTTPNPLAIALPIALGLLTALLMLLYAVLKRRQPEQLARILHSARSILWPCGRGGGGGGKGYGERQSRAQRVRLRGRDVEIKVVRGDLEGVRAEAARMQMRGGLGGGGGLASGGVNGDGGNVFRAEVRRLDGERV